VILNETEGCSLSLAKILSGLEIVRSHSLIAGFDFEARLENCSPVVATEEFSCKPWLSPIACRAAASNRVLVSYASRS
jgi:hypothetical protein